jgi:TonB family protein
MATEEIDMDSSSVPRNNRPITDEELSALLQEWAPVHAPASLEARVFSMPKHTLGGWSWMASRSVQVPVPVVAMTVALFLGLTVWGVVVGHNLPRATAEQIKPSMPSDLPDSSAGAELPLALSRSSAARVSAPADGGNPSGSWATPGPQDTPTPARIKVPGDVQAAKALHMVPPVYPPDARAKGVEGTVILDAIIAANGTVKELTAISGDSVLASAAITAVQQWVYGTTLLNGRPVEVETTISITFTLHEPAEAK